MFVPKLFAAIEAESMTIEAAKADNVSLKKSEKDSSRFDPGQEPRVCQSTDSQVVKPKWISFQLLQAQ
jgi:hypothetical protein